MKTSCALAAAAALGLAGLAPAQQVVIPAQSVTISGGGGGQIPRTSLDTYAGILALDDVQKEMAATLHEGYTEAYQAVSKERREQIDAAVRSADSNDVQKQHTLSEVMKTSREKTAALETSFMADLKSLLTEEQAARWPGVERTRRREVGLTRFGGISGEAVDLVDVARTLGLHADGLEGTLGQYELELDRAIRDRLDARDALAGAHGRIDAGAIEEKMAQSRESGLRVRDINRAFTRRIENQLAEPDRPPFLAEVHRRTFPQVYREPLTLKMYRAAQGFSDLSPDQREQVAADMQRYERELEAANSAWAGAISAAEESGKQGTFSFGTGGMNYIQTGDEPQALVDARKARRELDQRFRDRLKERLNKDQQDRLPNPESEDVGVRGVQIMTIDRDR